MLPVVRHPSPIQQITRIDVWLEYGAMCVYDADHPPEVGGLGDLDLFEATPEHSIVSHSQRQIHISLEPSFEKSPSSVDEEGSLRVRSGRVYVGSSEALIDPGAAGGAVIAVPPGLYRVAYVYQEDREMVYSVHFEVLPEQESETPSTPPTSVEVAAANLALGVSALDITSTFEKDKLIIQIRADGQAPRPTVELLRGREVLGQCSPTPLWKTDGRWVYEVWLVGPHEGADSMRLDW